MVQSSKTEFQLQTLFLFALEGLHKCRGGETPACIILLWRETAEENKEIERIQKERIKTESESDNRMREMRQFSEDWAL